MGFFDFIFRGPELSRFDALNICEKIATKLFKEELTIEIFVRDFDQILERYFRLYYPDCSIKPEQSKQIFEYCDVIHSIDRLKIVQIIKDLELEKRVQKEYFIQINTGDEEQKSGVKLADAEKFISDSLEKYQFKISGLMCLPPINDKPEKHFSILRGLAENFKIPYLSMGMSNDFELALMCGATHIRVGTLIFGERN